MDDSGVYASVARPVVGPATSVGGAGRNCVVVGSGTLAVQCAERLRETGHDLRAVLACDAMLEGWAARESVMCVASVEALVDLLDRQRVDWLFSVVNPVVLPARVLERVGEAFNYHDGPLPRYAGTHVTSWALLAGEHEHAITWHRMTAAVDAGDILVQRAVAITGGAAGGNGGTVRRSSGHSTGDRR